MTAKEIDSRVRMLETIKARCRGHQVKATFTGLDYKGEPYMGVGYPQATIQRDGKRVTGRVFWLARQACFEEEDRYKRG